MEGDLKKISNMEDDLKKSGRRPHQKNRRQPQAQFKKSTLIGCDIIVN
jgi:hypothetical protein